MKFRVIAALLMPLCYVGVAKAGTAADQFHVKIAVTAGCTLTAGADIDFGSAVGTAGQPATALTTITPTCTNGTPYTITFTGGQDADSTTKVMKGTGINADTLTYQLVDAVSGSTIYGSDVDHALGGTGTGSAQPTSIAAKLTNWSSKAVTPDAYSDLVTATISY